MNLTMSLKSGLSGTALESVSHSCGRSEFGSGLDPADIPWLADDLPLQAYGVVANNQTAEDPIIRRLTVRHHHGDL